MFSIHHSQLGLLYLLLSFILHPNICQERPQLSKAHMLPPPFTLVSGLSASCLHYVKVLQQPVGVHSFAFRHSVA